MKRHSLTAISAFSLLALPFASAQTGGGGNSPPLDQVYPGPLGNAEFGKVVAGEFTGDLSLDVVVMDGDEPVLAVSPEVFDSAIGTGAIANDIAVLSGVVSGKDLLVVVGNPGLQLYERDSDAGTWIVTTVHDALSAWGGAQAVKVGDLDGDGDSDLVGIGANGTSILIEYGNGDGTFTTGTGFSTYGAGSYDLQLPNWRETGDVAGTDEIVVFSGYGMEVYEADGSYLTSGAWTASPIWSTVIDDVGSSVQRLALVTKMGGNDWLTINGSAGAEGPYSLGAAGVVSMASGDADADGDSELFLGIDTANEFWMLENLSPGLVTYDVTLIDTYPYGPSGRDPSINAAGLATGDFDGDKVLDVQAPAQGDLTGVITVYGTMPVVHVGNSSPGDYHFIVQSASGYSIGGIPTALHLTLGQPTTLLTPGSGTVKLSVKVWRTPDFGVATIPDTYHEEVISIASPMTFASIPLPPGFSWDTSSDVFSFVIRQVEVLNDEVLEAAPALTGLIVSGEHANVVLNLPDVSFFLQVYDGGSSTPSNGAVGVGPPVPPTDPGAQPSSPTSGS